LGSVSFLPGSQLKTIGMYAFWNCTSLTSITIPYGVTVIDYSAFRGCTGLTGVTVPNSVTAMGASVFWGCTSLSSLSLPFVGANRTSAGTSAGLFGHIFGTTPNTGCTATNQYYNSSSYATYQIPNSLKTVTITDTAQIPYGAFYGCANLTGVTLPGSLTSIGMYAFTGCAALTGITIPALVTSLNYTFVHCPNLTTVNFAPGSQLTAIGQDAFWECHSLTGFVIPSGVTSIGQSAFRNCVSLTSLTIPSTVSNIGYKAFDYCSNLTIYAQASSKPAGWDANWNPLNRPVVWGCSVTSGYVTSFTKSGTNPSNPGGNTVNNPQRAGYTFDGWYTNSAFTGTKYATVAAAPNGTLYAKWT